MPKLEIAGFDGEVPRQSATMLANNQAQQADNVKLYSRELRFWRGPELAYLTTTTGIQSIYRMTSEDDVTLWLTWDTDVDVEPGPLADDNGDRRIYYTGDGAPKKTNYSLASTGSEPYPVSSYDMGVPYPQIGPAVAIGADKSTFVLEIDSNVAANDSGDVGATMAMTEDLLTAAAETFTYETIGTNTTVRIQSYVVPNLVGTATKSPTQAVIRTLPTGTGSASSDQVSDLSASSIETRAYVYTYISRFGSLVEESAPSPPSPLIDVDHGQAVTISGFEPTPAGSHGIYGRRIYRTVTGATTDTYEFVTEIELATTSYIDVLSVQKLGEVLPTPGWLPPPAELQGLVSHPSGALAGFVDNTLYFSEPYYPHAWPREYALNFPSDIVGLGVFGNTIVVATDRYPYVVNGVAPGAMSSERVPIVEPCVSKRSIASDGDGVVYASPNGLVVIGQGGAGLATEHLYRREEWELEEPSTLIGAVHDNKYFGARPGQLAMVLSRKDIPALSFLDVDAEAFFVDTETADLYYVSAESGDIYKMDADELRPFNFEWMSKRFALPRGETFSAIMVDAAYEDLDSDDRFNAAIEDLEAANATTWASGILDGALARTTLNEVAVNGSNMYEIPEVASTRSVTVLVYVDNEHVQSVTPVSLEPIRLKPWRGREVEIKIVGNIGVRSVVLASTVPELVR